MNNDLTNLMEQDFEQTLASSVEKLDDGDLKSVSGLAEKIRHTENFIADLEKQLKQTKQDLLQLTDRDLPDMMLEVGMLKFSLGDGAEVTLKATYGGYIKLENRPQAFEWLRENGYDDIIKNKVSSTFGRGEDDQANAFVAFAKKEGYEVDQKMDIAPQTLKKFIKIMTTEGNDYPSTLFGAHNGQRAVIKGSK